MHQNRRQSFVHFYASDCDTRDGQMTTVSLVKCVAFLVEFIPEHQRYWPRLVLSAFCHSLSITEISVVSE